MATVDVEDVPLTGPKAHRLADMAGIHMDLNWTVEACARLIQGSQQPQPDIVTDAIHDAALIRYGRCFRGGKRNAFQIPNDWLPARLKQTHDDALALRNKHIAHSANDWEINVPVAEMARAGAAATVRSVSIRQMRAVLGRKAIRRLHELVVGRGLFCNHLRVDLIFGIVDDIGGAEKDPSWYRHFTVEQQISVSSTCPCRQLARTLL